VTQWCSGCCRISHPGTCSRVWVHLRCIESAYGIWQAPRQNAPRQVPSRSQAAENRYRKQQAQNRQVMAERNAAEQAGMQETVRKWQERQAAEIPSMVRNAAAAGNLAGRYGRKTQRKRQNLCPGGRGRHGRNPAVAAEGFTETHI